MLYKIIFKEKLVHCFEIEADSIEEAEAKWNEMADNGELDFSSGEVYDSTVDISEA